MVSKGYPAPSLIPLRLPSASSITWSPPLIAEWLPLSSILYPVVQQIILGDVDAQAGLETAAEQGGPQPLRRSRFWCW